MAADLQPEERARVLIDEQLTEAGWHVCDRDHRDLTNRRSNGIREVILDAGHGRADYLLYVDRRIVGVIEAKPVGTPLIGVQWQAWMYVPGRLGTSPGRPWRKVTPPRGGRRERERERDPVGQGWRRRR